MFLTSILIGIIIGLLLKGNIKNIDVSKLKGVYIVFLAFIIEIILFSLVRKGILVRSLLTTLIYLIQYMLVLIFIYLNRQNKAILLIGLGFLLNAIVIFSNGGAMPVNPNAIVEAGIAPSIDKIELSNEGLYVLQNANTMFWFLGDVIPIKYIRHYVVSIGDIIISLGLICYIVTEMKTKAA